MPIIHEHTTPQHQVLINQSIIKRVESDIKKLTRDIDEIKETLLFIRKYIEIKKARVANRA